MAFILALFAIIPLIFLVKNILNLAFAMENYNVHKKRLKQLHFDKKKEDADIHGLVDTVTKPVIRYVLPRLKPKDLDQLERDLKMAKWDKYMSAIQFRALNIILKTMAILAVLILWNSSKFLALVWGVVLFLGLPFLMTNSKNNRKQKLLSDFPDFIRIVEGYLSANMTFPQAVAESIKYVGEEWKPILQEFVIECDVKSLNEALESLKRNVDLFEVREFVAYVKLTLENGGDAKDCLSEQADKIHEMQVDMMAMKISKRQIMATLLQAPILLCIFGILGLPLVESMVNLTSL